MLPVTHPNPAWGGSNTCNKRALLRFPHSQPVYRSSTCTHTSGNHLPRPRPVCCSAAEEDPYAALQQAAAASGLRITFSSSEEDEEDWEEVLEDLDDPWTPAAPEWLDLLDQDPTAAATALRPTPPPAPPSTPAPGAQPDVARSEAVGEVQPQSAPGASLDHHQQQQQQPLLLGVPLVPPVEMLEVAGGLTIPCIAPEQLPALAAAAAGGAVVVQLLEAAGDAAGSSNWSSLLPPISQVCMTIPQLTAAAAAPCRASQAAVVVADTGDYRALQACIRLSRVYALPQVYMLKG